MGGGLLPVALFEGQLLFLFGEEADEHRWIDFGGGSKPGETLLQNVLRESTEELDGFLGSQSEIKNLIKTNLLVKLSLETYTSFLVYVPYEPNLPFYFNNHHKFIKAHLPHLICKNGMYEKRQIKWMTLKEIKERRGQFRPYYREMLDQILAHEAFLKTEIKRNFL
jgi:hypothetical protein